MTSLLIVESPAKAKTIKKYLGKDFEVMASYGHVRDLLPKKGAVNPDKKFAMQYELIEKNKKHVDAITKALKTAETLYLATDPDREGEAIAWHLHEFIKTKKTLNKKPVHRVVFHEITKNAVNEAMKNPRGIAMDLVNAQQARRALDYLVGFTLSPLLWKKIQRGLSAGRVQSPALRLIVEREQEIEAFTAQEYWTITAQCQTADQAAFAARLMHYQNEKIQQFSITNGDQAAQIKADLLQAAKGKLTVQHIEKKQRKRQPSPPFTTSTLQQEASHKLGFTAQRTMRTAQQLYENGLITYMRTDAVYLAQDAVTEIRAFIAKKFGQDYVPEAVRVYRAKSKSAQEAHEAIRPTSVLTLPASLSSLTPEQLKLYDLIWKRTVACQMTHALLDTIAADLACGKAGVFRASGSTIAHPGFMAVYPKARETDETLLPSLKAGDSIDLADILDEQHFTEPPPRYSEATLVKALEECGIGRPSTYASIISTLQSRKYADLIEKRFHPTDVGRIVNKFLTQYFTKYVDYDFTANLEDELDAVARGEKQWIPLLEAFWSPFNHQIHDIEQTIQRKDVTHETLNENCPKCSKPLSIRLGKRGRFIGCTGYPECDYTSNLDGTVIATPEVIPDKSCPECNSPLLLREGRFGKFIGCSSYPKCKFIESSAQTDTGIECPQCRAGKLRKRKSRRGSFFYSCSTYPKCDYLIGGEPVDKPCPQCHWPILMLKTTKRRGTEEICPHKCGYSAQVNLTA